MTHVNDDQIQEFLDGNPTPDRAEIAAHIESCAECRAKVKEYERLYSAMSVDTGFDLPTDFAASVAARVMPAPVVQPEAEPEPRFKYSDMLLFAGALAAAIGALIYFRDFSAIFGGFKEKLANSALNTTIVTTIGELLSGMGVQGQFLLSAVGALLMVILMDRLMRTVRRGKAMFFA
jgi:hypothetical protein